jgi:transcriptional regulator with XRE-family HTH domain
MPRRTRKIASAEKAIGARIADIRKRQAMTQVELAARLGMGQSLLSRYERGTLRLHGALVVDVARALQVSTDELLGLKDSKGNGHGFLAERRFMRRLRQIEGLSKRKKEALLTTIDAFLRGEDRR